MSQFAGDDVISVYDTINDGKAFVPKEPEYEPYSRRKKIFFIIVGVAVAVFMIVAAIQIIPSWFV